MTLIFRMGQAAWYYYIWFGRQPILRLWMAATNRHLGYPRCTAKNHWRCVEAHYQKGAVNVSFTLCQERPSVCTVWIVPTTSPSNYRTYKTENRWRSIDSHFNVWWTQDLLPLIIAILNNWTLWMPFSMIRTSLYGKAEPSHIQAVVALIRLKFICYAKWCILPAKGLFDNEYSLATGQHSSIIIL